MRQGLSGPLWAMILSLPQWTPEQAADEIASIRRAGADMLAHPEKHRAYLKKLMAFAKQARAQEIPVNQLPRAKKGIKKKILVRAS